MSSTTILSYAQRLKSISHLGLTYSNNEYDTERYRELEQISFEMMQMATGLSLEPLTVYFSQTKEYITPKVDIRAVIFNDQNEILLVKEKADGKWSLPGGWADIGQSPTEVAVKEALEETGFNVKPIKLLAVLDKRCHPHPPQLDYVYKIFIQCEAITASYTEAFDILDVKFFNQESIPVLSEDRVLSSQIDLMFEYLHNPEKQALID
ncbi:NUDIX hydrolase [Mucilaginibacter sabulilitoris]|uniref:NUDIX hydrolase n=1 Tax=Mucilaginibacter sabulilitoris TaxID=1173583 RepID=A0ABZ0TL12_9SPHI|nr:NUDIX hydrolase [Mucilaginibacter sabulilitoris]WPU93842.1 NUDIX hydrolase [Mucilaginibacter sabulilitoris]